MTEKQFIKPYEDCRVIKNIHTGETATYYDTEDGLMFLKWLNNLSDENEQLKQFKEDVFAKIDMHLRMLPTARDNEFNEEYGDPSLYTGAIYMLETLKKELKE